LGAIGAFTFVLHSHLPYVRLAGRWPHGEEWIHEAISETYLPLLELLYRLKSDGIQYRLTLGLTPVLIEQLTDPLVLEHFDQFLSSKIDAAIRDIAYFSNFPEQPFLDTEPLNSSFPNPSYRDNEGNVAVAAYSGQVLINGESQPADKLLELAEWYQNYYQNIRIVFNEQFQRDLIGAFRRLQDEGYIEIITSPATHAYLPLLTRDSAINAQLKAGLATYRRNFGREPTAIWLPECAYRPAYIANDGTIRPGLEYFLAKHNLKVFFSETHAITGGTPVGVAAGDAIGPYGDIKRRYLIPTTSVTPARAATTYHPYYVSNSTEGLGAEDHSGVAVVGRNNRTGLQVWSAEWGYPGDFDYREFHKKSGTSGLQYWRVTGARTDMAHKEYYDPEWALFKVEQHAEHFTHLVYDLLRDFHNKTGEYGLISSNYDTELFGHWWFEGVQWLERVLRFLATSPDIEMTQSTQYIMQHPPTEVINLPEGSWGAGGNHFTWDNPDNHWMWEPIAEAELRMERNAMRYSEATPEQESVLNQAARELMLLESSDWTFLVTTGQAREYAIQRFNQHFERFVRLIESLEQGEPNVALAEEYYELDKIFPDVDYRWYISE
jgi:1,4-alpha-glucan branching enzyme